MATSKGNERIRFRYGICLNESCPKCKSKEVQEIPARKELVCTECGKPLRECPPPTPKSNTKLYVAIAAAVVVLGGGAFALFGGGGEEKAAPVAPEVEQVDTTKVDSTATEAPAAPEATQPEAAKPEPAKPEPPKTDGGSKPAGKNPSWGTYSGERNAQGLPNGAGVLKITRSTTINGESAQAGERLEGVFRDGYLNMGRWFKNDGNVVTVKDVKCY